MFKAYDIIVMQTSVVTQSGGRVFKQLNSAGFYSSHFIADSVYTRLYQVYICMIMASSCKKYPIGCSFIWLPIMWQ